MRYGIKVFNKISRLKILGRRRQLAIIVVLLLAHSAMPRAVHAAAVSFRSEAAKSAYRKYEDQKLHKAFAQSPTGAWGVSAGRANVREAQEEALRICAERVLPSDPQCTIWDSDDTPVSDAEDRESDAIRASVDQYIGAMLRGAISKPFDDASVYPAAARLRMLPHVRKLSWYAQYRTRSLADRAFAKLNKNDHAGAISLLREAIDIAPHSPELYRSLGISLLAIGKDREAEQALKEAIRSEPWDSIAWQHLGIAYFNQKRQEDARGAIVLAFEWSKNKQKTFEEYKSIASDSPYGGMRRLYSAAIADIEYRFHDLKRAYSELLSALETQGWSPSLPKISFARTTDPVIEYCPRPEYPLGSFFRREQGTVSLAILRSGSDAPKRAFILQSSGYDQLDYAAVIGLYECRLRGRTHLNTAEGTWSRLEYLWQLN
ncbi:MAG TPA: tetratricopeptide repeat protein [Paucimonas sp.]|nr:tetratricopeptide repeat protein [Paucimonas sp.]